MPTAEQERQEKVQQALMQPFATSQIKWKPQITKKKNGDPYIRNGRQVAGCTAHIDARDVMNRLDEVVGVFGWSDMYQVLPNSKNVECTLTVMGVTKSDVGEVNPDGFADPLKTAYSDALKRAAVKFGIGRHLYEMDIEWKLYDGYKIIEDLPPAPKSTQPKQNKTRPPQPQRNYEGTKALGDKDGFIVESYPGETIDEQVADFKEPTANGKPDEEEIDHLTLCLEAADLKTFADHAYHVLDKYDNAFNVVGALVNKYPEAHGLEKFVYGRTKQGEYLDWLAERKEAADG